MIIRMKNNYYRTLYINISILFIRSKFIQYILLYCIVLYFLNNKDKLGML